MRKLVVVSAAIAALAIVLYSLRPQPVTFQSRISDEQPAAGVSAAPLPPPLAPPAARTSEQVASAQPAPAAEAHSGPASVPPNDERKQRAACRAMWDRKRNREQAAHDAEIKDPAWAYPMEQKLREYLSRSFQTIPIVVTVVDCKTTFCDVTAQGFSPETGGEFNRVVTAVGEEAWNDFTGISLSLSEESDKLIYTAEVRRKQSYETAGERREEQAQMHACIALSSRQAQRARDARDSQPRDAGWADPLEQLLRQHFTTQLRTHGVESLDIRCLTTFCTIKASGRTQDSRAAFQKAAQDVSSEPWAGLRAGEVGSSGYGDSWTADFTLYRQ